MFFNEIVFEAKLGLLQHLVAQFVSIIPKTQNITDFVLNSTAE